MLALRTRAVHACASDSAMPSRIRHGGYASEVRSRLDNSSDGRQTARSQAGMPE